jgi:hypothetical protein
MDSRVTTNVVTPTGEWVPASRLEACGLILDATRFGRLWSETRQA